MNAIATQLGAPWAPAYPELAGAAPWLSRLRERARERFEALGFPTPHDEAWRYTGLQPVTETAWQPARSASAAVSPLPSGARLRRLAELSEAEAASRFGQIARWEDRPFVALNTAQFADALVLEIAPGAVLADPIEIRFDAGAPGTPEASAPRLLVLAGEGSQSAVVEMYRSAGPTLTNAVTEIALAPGAILEHTKLQEEGLEARHVHALAVRQARSSRFTSHNVALGASLARTELSAVLAGEGAECALNGLFVGAGRQHLDNRTVIDHAVPHTASRQLYKGVMDGASRGVFHGTVIVRPDAQKTDAIQTNKNLLLSREALVNSTPALEIFADDVKCKHGSTTGQLDAVAMFYLRSRGIGEADARALLTWAFAADVVEKIRIPGIRSRVERELGLRLPGAASGEAA